MKVDVQSLGTLNELAHGGAEQATRALAQMTGIDAEVDVTQITIVDRNDIGEELVGDEFVGVKFDFEGELTGDTVLVFEEDATDTIIESLLGTPDDEDMARSSVEEIGNIMMSGFIDGWADYLETTIDHSPPEYIECEGADVLPTEPAGADRDQVFVFRSEVSWAGEAASFYIYMLPEYDPLADMMGDQASTEQDAIPLEKLEAFKEMTQRGTENAAENVEMMSGIATDAEVTRICFAPIEDVPKRLGDDVIVGTVVELTGEPSGYLMVLFDEESARTVAEELMPVEMDTDELTDQHKAAIEELGNIMTSGFVDGWANVLQRSIDHSPPRLVHDMGRAVIDPLAAQLGQHQQHAFIIDSQMRTENLDFHSEIHALPDEAELREALDDLLIDRIDETEADTEQIF
jgi:chemotaxis protein CheC